VSPVCSQNDSRVTSKVNFPKDVALWRFCRNPCQETLKPFFSEHLRTGADLGLKVALRGKCQHQGANGFKNPEKGLMFFLLDFGEADDDGLPISENMTLRVYEVTDAEAIAAGTAAIKEAAKSPTKRRAVQRCAGEDLQFSLESARRWDLDPSVATKKRKDGRNEWTYAQRWESFVEWVRMICLVSLWTDGADCRWWRWMRKSSMRATRVDRKVGPEIQIVHRLRSTSVPSYVFDRLLTLDISFLSPKPNRPLTLQPFTYIARPK